MARSSSVAVLLSGHFTGSLPLHESLAWMTGYWDHKAGVDAGVDTNIITFSIISFV